MFRNTTNLYNTVQKNFRVREFMDRQAGKTIKKARNFFLNYKIIFHLYFEIALRTNLVQCLSVVVIYKFKQFLNLDVIKFKSEF